MNGMDWDQISQLGSPVTRLVFVSCASLLNELQSHKVLVLGNQQSASYPLHEVRASQRKTGSTQMELMTAYLNMGADAAVILSMIILITRKQ